MPNTTVDSPSYEKVLEPDLIEALLREICIVFANGNSFCARLIAVRDNEELWFESKSGQKWMVQRKAVTGIRPLHKAPGRQ
jgi:hypothetical protein